MKKLLIAVAGFGLLASCGEGAGSISAKDGEITSSVSSSNQTPAEIQAELEAYEREEKKRQEAEEANMTSLSFDRMKHDFGDVKPESENKTTFTVTNTGDKPLIIEDVSASCGCTTPKKPEGPIAPGESDEIEVVFKPKPSQRNEIKKTVTVVANTNPKVTMLEIRSFVKE